MIRDSLISVFVLMSLACSDGTEADRLGVGAECATHDDCDDTTEQQCLSAFKGGYCGIENCVDDADCPDASACVAHSDGANYCFRICTDKTQCNENRSPEQESNCSANVTFVETQEENIKACVPPSG